MIFLQVYENTGQIVRTQKKLHRFKLLVIILNITVLTSNPKLEDHELLQMTHIFSCAIHFYELFIEKITIQCTSFKIINKRFNFKVINN